MRVRDRVNGPAPRSAGLVVGAAVVRQGRVLAARRTGPPAVKGGWEFPGGKVEVGEGPEAALVREIAEELGCRVAVECWLEGEQPVGDRLVLRVAACRLVEGDPTSGAEHDELRWLAAAELHDVGWLDPDRPFLPGVRAHLIGSTA
jgi:8-oxo-dGTP diphosphatase